MLKISSLILTVIASVVIAPSSRASSQSSAVSSNSSLLCMDYGLSGLKRSLCVSIVDYRTKIGLISNGEVREGRLTLDTVGSPDELDTLKRGMYDDVALLAFFRIEKKMADKGFPCADEGQARLAILSGPVIPISLREYVEILAPYFQRSKLSR